MMDFITADSHSSHHQRVYDEVYIRHNTGNTLNTTGTMHYNIDMQ